MYKYLQAIMYQSSVSLIFFLPFKKISDPRIKLILLTIGTVGMKKFLTDGQYSTEKYSLFAWLIVRFEHFASVIGELRSIWSHYIGTNRGSRR
jgi:hypothetical protein